MIGYGSLEVKVSKTVLGVFKLRREHEKLFSVENELTLLDNCIERLDQLIKSLTSVEKIDRNLAFPDSCTAIPLEAHDTACVLTWPEWFRNAAPFAQLSLLIDWRRALLHQRESATNRDPEPAPMPAAVLEAQRRAARERKQRSRDRKRQAAILAGTWRAPGRPKQNRS